ncbi:hypothetical protein LTR37_005873 [Vermiconidia calcicola]|uniref:Uncharacterized protein n=1 Tax=Vermiconidia calcicola TaxID=1690605 RepID=A0ACC3NI48_9PEZI|nr:hypothetical protein LTR37_005873 [Vermiconidia calcicola]
MGSAPHSSAPELLDLPAELRNAIYRHALVPTDPIDIRTARTDSSLLRTCKQIYWEARPIFFSKNDFAYAVSNFNSRGDDFRTVVRWLDGIGKENAESIKNFAMQFQAARPLELRTPNNLEYNYLSLEKSNDFLFKVLGTTQSRLTRNMARALVDLTRSGLQKTSISFTELAVNLEDLVDITEGSILSPQKGRISIPQKVFYEEARRTLPLLLRTTDCEAFLNEVWALP